MIRALIAVIGNMYCVSIRNRYLDLSIVFCTSVPLDCLVSPENAPEQSLLVCMHIVYLHTPVFQYYPAPTTRGV